MEANNSGLTSLSRLSSKLSLFLRALRMNSAMGLLLLPSWLRLKVPSLFSFLRTNAGSQVRMIHKAALPSTVQHWVVI